MRALHPRGLRSHVVAVLAVLLALATGIAVGAGPLQQEVEARATSSPTADDPGELARAEAEVEALRRGAAYDDRFAASLSGPLLRDALRGRAVTLLVLPGADDATVSGLTATVQRAGGRVATTAVADEALLDVADRQLVGELGSQLADSPRTRVRVPGDAGDYERMGRVLARALVTPRAAGDATDEVADSLLAGLRTAGLLTVTEGPGERGSLVLAVAGAPYGSEDERAGAGTITASLLATLAGPAAGVVLAGPVSSTAADGLVGQVRSDPTSRRSVSTVDVADRVAGRIAAVRALAAAVRGPAGHYGSDAAPDGVAPSLR